MKNKLSLLLLVAAVGIFACKSETAQTTEAAAETTAPAADAAAAEDAINIEVPAEFLVSINENGEFKIMNEAIDPKDFEKKVTEWFEGYRAMGTKTMPPLKMETVGTVGMAARTDIEGRYNDLKTKFEGLH
jgi:hypothetical protein